jgi:hypothetical protein
MPDTYLVSGNFYFRSTITVNVIYQKEYIDSHSTLMYINDGGEVKWAERFLQIY